MPVTPDFKTRLAKITQRNRNSKHIEGRAWPQEKRLEVVGQYLVLGNMRIVAATTGVPYDVVRKWKGQPWWAEFEAELRATQNIELDTKLTKIVDKSLEATYDRVENGDFIYDQKSGEVRRKPVALRDVHRVAVDLMDRREVLRGNSHDRKEHSQISVQEQLKLLAQEFAKWVDNDKHPIIELEEIDDAVYVDKDSENHIEGRTSDEEIVRSFDGTEATGPSDSDKEGAS